jgi:hypothetical protein
MLLWAGLFLEAQGYGCNESILYQDNQSTILLQRNGRKSSSRRTRHLDIRYYFITDRIDRGDLKVEYCPTEDLVADFYTKPLQGQLFRKFRSIIMNLKDLVRYALTRERRSVLEIRSFERVVYLCELSLSWMGRLARFGPDKLTGPNG